MTVTESLDYFGSITETVIVGEYNAGNGYQMSGSFIGLDEVITAPVGGAWVKVTVEVDGFNDGTGQNSVVMSSWIRIERCKQGTTTTAATTTTIPVTIGAEVAASCVLEQDIATYPITVTVSGDDGATGVVTINGVDTPYAIDGSGEAVVAANGMAGDNTVEVVDDIFGSILSEIIALVDCTETTTTTEGDNDNHRGHDHHHRGGNDDDHGGGDNHHHGSRDDHHRGGNDLHNRIAFDRGNGSCVGAPDSHRPDGASSDRH